MLSEALYVAVFLTLTYKFQFINTALVKVDCVEVEKKAEFEFFSEEDGVREHTFVDPSRKFIAEASVLVFVNNPFDNHIFVIKREDCPDRLFALCVHSLLEFYNKANIAVLKVDPAAFISPTAKPESQGELVVETLVVTICEI